MRGFFLPPFPIASSRLRYEQKICFRALENENGLCRRRSRCGLLTVARGTSEWANCRRDSLHPPPSPHTLACLVAAISPAHSCARHLADNEQWQLRDGRGVAPVVLPSSCIQCVLSREPLVVSFVLPCPTGPGRGCTSVASVACRN